MGNAAPTRSATEFEVATLHRVRALLEDNSSKTSKQLLKRLWAAAMPPEVPYAATSPNWAKLGFQHLDPRADLRGGGCLALEQLVFALEIFPSTFVHIANQAQRRSPDEYLPLARIGIQITYELCKLFDDVDAQLPYWRLARQEDTFHEFYVFVLLLVVEEARYQKRGMYDYSQESSDFFEPVMMASRASLKHLLSQGPSTVPQLYLWANVPAPVAGATHLKLDLRTSHRQRQQHRQRQHQYHHSQLSRGRSPADATNADDDDNTLSGGWQPMNLRLDKLQHEMQYPDHGGTGSMGVDAPQYQSGSGPYSYMQPPMAAYRDPLSNSSGRRFVPYIPSSQPSSLEAPPVPSDLPVPDGVQKRYNPAAAAAAAASAFADDGESGRDPQSSGSSLGTTRKKKSTGEAAKWEQFLNRVGREELRKEQEQLRADQAKQYGDHERASEPSASTSAPSPAAEPAESVDGNVSETPSVKKHCPRPPPGPPPPPPPVVTAQLTSPVQSPRRSALTPRSAMGQGGWLWRWWSDAEDYENEESVTFRTVPHLPPPEQAAWFRVVYDEQSIPALTWSSNPEDVAPPGCALRFTVVQKIIAFDRAPPTDQNPSERAAPGCYLRVFLWNLGASFILRAPSPSLRNRWLKALSSFVSEHGAAPPPPPPVPPVDITTTSGNKKVSHENPPTIPWELRVIQNRGATMLHQMARADKARNQLDELEKMIDAGNDVCALDSLERTPLHYALLPDSLLTNAPPPRTLGFASYDYISALTALPALSEDEETTIEKTVLLLCDALGGSDALDATDVYGATAVHLASGRRMPRALRALLQTAADPSLPDRKGRTPLDIASSQAIEHVSSSSVLAKECVAVLREYGAEAGQPREVVSAATSEARQGAVLEAFMEGAMMRSTEAETANADASPPPRSSSPRVSDTSSNGRTSTSPKNSPNEAPSKAESRVSAHGSPKVRTNSATSRSQSPPNQATSKHERTPGGRSTRALPQLSPAARSAINENTITDVPASPILAPPPPMLFGSSSSIDAPPGGHLHDDDFLDPGRPFIRPSSTSPNNVAVAYRDTSPGAELNDEPLVGDPPQLHSIASTPDGVALFSPAALKSSERLEVHVDTSTALPTDTNPHNGSESVDLRSGNGANAEDEGKRTAEIVTDGHEHEKYDEDATDVLQSSIANLSTADQYDQHESPWTEYLDEGYAYIYNHVTEESHWGTLAEHFPTHYSDHYGVSGALYDEGTVEHGDASQYYDYRVPNPWDAASISSTGESEVTAPTTSNSTPSRSLRVATEEGLSQYLASPAPPTEYNSNAEEQARAVDENRRLERERRRQKLRKKREQSESPRGAKSNSPVSVWGASPRRSQQHMYPQGAAAPSTPQHYRNAAPSPRQSMQRAPSPRSHAHLHAAAAQRSMLPPANYLHPIEHEHMQRQQQMPPHPMEHQMPQHRQRLPQQQQHLPPDSQRMHYPPRPPPLHPTTSNVLPVQPDPSRRRMEYPPPQGFIDPTAGSGLPPEPPLYRGPQEESSRQRQPHYNYPPHYAHSAAAGPSQAPTPRRGARIPYNHPGVMYDVAPAPNVPMPLDAFAAAPHLYYHGQGSPQPRMPQPPYYAAPAPSNVARRDSSRVQDSPRQQARQQYPPHLQHHPPSQPRGHPSQHPLSPPTYTRRLIPEQLGSIDPRNPHPHGMGHW